MTHEEIVNALNPDAYAAEIAADPGAVAAIVSRAIDAGRVAGLEIARLERDLPAPRSLANVDTASAAATTSDIRVTGNPDVWRLVCKASSASQGWMKSTKALAIGGGVVLQVTTEHRDPSTGLVVACAEALCFVPGGELP